MVGIQFVIIRGGVVFPMELCHAACHAACALTTVTGLVSTTRPLLRDSQKLKEILAIQRRTTRQTVMFADEEQQLLRDPQLAG
mmetsp:Transcript_43140/g.59892  ORF Transcript_43140/g.59892 Transcript_43140/m.59892 type:complete len:83 (-) Transcript_43140:70-318(-)